MSETPRPQIDLMDRTAVVTGGTSGIGADIARAMAVCGARVVVVGRNKMRLATVCSEIEAGGGTVKPVAVDLASDDAPSIIVEQTIEEFGSLDILVQSAGVFEPQPFASTPAESLDRTLRVNIRAPYLLTQAALPHLRNGGVVIFVSSIVGRIASGGAAAYAASKGAVEQLTKSLALELGWEGVRVNAIAPGDVRTPMNEHQYTDPNHEKSRIAITPSGRVGRPSDIAALAVFLASDHASQILGESIMVDGGRGLGSR